MDVRLSSPAGGDADGVSPGDALDGGSESSLILLSNSSSFINTSSSTPFLSILEGSAMSALLSSNSREAGRASVGVLGDCGIVEQSRVGIQGPGIEDRATP